MKRVAILGSTGSIGTQTLDVIRKNADKLQVVSLVAFSREDKLALQVAEFSPNYHALISKQGKDCLIQAVQGADVAVIATRGIIALECVIYCLKNGIDVALANKEVLVCGGQLVMPLVGKSKLLPIDSEHCAISQCLLRNDARISQILLTASGGPFWNTPQEQLIDVTASQALKHPNWAMGSKITIDSATMMNKTLEVLEASWLFDVPVDKIKIVVHRQSVAHSLVSFSDGSVMAQMATPDMRLPIQIALLGNGGGEIVKPLDFDAPMQLTFEPCNGGKFPCSQLAYSVKKAYSLAPTVMNSTNDVCVDYFLQGKIVFTQFFDIINFAVNHFEKVFGKVELTVENIIYCDQCVRDFTKKYLDGEIC